MTLCKESRLDSLPWASPSPFRSFQVHSGLSQSIPVFPSLPRNHHSKGSPSVHLPEDPDFQAHPTLISSSLPVVFDLHSHPP